MVASPNRIQSEADAVKFMKSVKFALRYNSTPSLPLASMFEAAHDKRVAIELANALLAKKEVVETNVVADRLVLVHRDVVPALYMLRTRHVANLSQNAARTFELIHENGTATVGEVRRFLGVEGLKRPDPADIAVGDLQREMLIDRGPSGVPKKGIPYLSKEGFPYRVFAKSHPDLVMAAKQLSSEEALQIIRDAVGPIPPRKFASMFRLLI
jgi:hypothetical protein